MLREFQQQKMLSKYVTDSRFKGPVKEIATKNKQTKKNLFEPKV